jgi:RNA polymerase sigma-70 factor (ECF subfamily)
MEDEELVRRFLAGERSAFEALVRRHQDRVFGLCVRLLGSRTWAEEAAQDVLIRVYRSLHQFRGDSRFSTWLYRVTLNHCRNVQAYRARRHEKRHDSIDAEVDEEEGGGRRRELPDGSADAEAELLKQQRLHVLEDELAKLDPLWKEILVLRDVEGMSYDEIGAALGLAEGTVKSRLHRARAELLARVSRRMKGDAR